MPICITRFTKQKYKARNLDCMLLSAHVLHSPGPFAPPVIRRPSRKITARSYSCTTCCTDWPHYNCEKYVKRAHMATKTPVIGPTLKHTNRLSGIVHSTSTHDSTINMRPHVVASPLVLASAANRQTVETIRTEAPDT